MPDHGMRPVITSNDHRFLAAVRDKLPRQSTGSPSWHALLVNLISSSRLTASISPAVEEIFEREKDWRDDENNAGKAQQFVSTVRLYIESRLWNLLATDPIVMHKPTQWRPSRYSAFLPDHQQSASSPAGSDAH